MNYKVITKEHSIITVKRDRRNHIDEERAIIPREEKIVAAEDKRDAIMESGFDRKYIAAVIPLDNNALVLDKKKGWGVEFVLESDIPKDSPLCTYKDMPVFLLIREYGENGGSELKPFVPPPTITTTPDLLHRAIKWDEAKVLFTEQYRDMGKVQTGLLVGILIVLLVAVWLVGSG